MTALAIEPPGAARRTLARLLRHRLGRAGLVLLCLLVATAVMAPWLSPYDPADPSYDEVLAAPNLAHPFGTDNIGRDMLSRVIYGARVSLEVIAVSTLGSVLVGAVIGMVSGYIGGRTDAVIMRITDGLLAFPMLILALAIVAALGPSLENAILAITLVNIPGFARLVRGQVLGVRQLDHVQSARALGVPDWRIMTRHVWPMVIGSVIVYASLRAAAALITEASLAFLGLGAQPPTPSWGGMLTVAMQYWSAWWLSVFPGGAIFLTVLALNFLGDGLRDSRDVRLYEPAAGPRRPLPRTIMPPPPRGEAALALAGLSVDFDGMSARAVDGVSFRLVRGETLAVVGESGSGKSVTGLAVMGLLPTPPARIERGSALLRRHDGTTADLLALPGRDLAGIRGNDIAMIFQEPMTSLNPQHSIGDQIAEAMILHRGEPRGAARAHAAALLERVGLQDARRRLDAYPHELSGGMRQRVMIAMALACGPAVLIADEPTTALDVTIQAQILELLRDLQAETRMAMLFITHDFGVVAEIAQRVMVMYAGEVVEEGPVAAVLQHPLHPYTAALLAALPRIDRPRVAGSPGRARHATLAAASTQGCRYRSRCVHAVPDVCDDTQALVAADAAHAVRCARWAAIAEAAHAG